MEPARRGFVRPRGSCAIVGRTGEEELLIVQKRRARTSGCSAHRGSFEHVSVPFRRLAFSNGGATQEFHSGRVCGRQPSNSCAAPSSPGTSFIGPRGSSIMRVRCSMAVPLSHGGASSARAATIGRTSTARARHAPVPSFVRPVRAHPPAGLVSRSKLNVGNSRSLRWGPSLSRRLAGSLMRCGSRAHFCAERAQSGPGVSRSVPGERRVFQRPPFRCRRRWHPRAAWRVVRPSEPSPTCGTDARAFERPSNTALQPANGARRQSGTLEHRALPNHGAAQYWRRARSNARGRRSRLNANR